MSVSSPWRICLPSWVPSGCVSAGSGRKKAGGGSPTLVVGTPDHVREFRRTLESNHVDFRNGLLVMAPEEVDSAVVRNLLIKNCVSKVVFLPEEVDSSVARCLVELCGKMGVDFTRAWW